MEVRRRPQTQPADGEGEGGEEDDEDAGREDGWSGVERTQACPRDDELRAVDEPRELEGVHDRPHVHQPLDLDEV